MNTNLWLIETEHCRCESGHSCYHPHIYNPFKCFFVIFFSHEFFLYYSSLNAKLSTFVFLDERTHLCVYIQNCYFEYNDGWTCTSQELHTAPFCQVRVLPVKPVTSKKVKPEGDLVKHATVMYLCVGVTL